MVCESSRHASGTGLVDLLQGKTGKLRMCSIGSVCDEDREEEEDEDEAVDDEMVEGEEGEGEGEVEVEASSSTVIEMEAEEEEAEGDVEVEENDAGEEAEELSCCEVKYSHSTLAAEEG